MPESSIHDRRSIERLYPREVFLSDANANMAAQASVLHGVRVRSASDRSGRFELTRAARHTGEQDDREGGVFLSPFAQATGHGADYPHSASAAGARGRQKDTYDAFIDSIIEAARHAAPGGTSSTQDARLRGLQQ